MSALLWRGVGERRTHLGTTLVDVLAVLALALEAVAASHSGSIDSRLVVGLVSVVLGVGHELVLRLVRLEQDDAVGAAAARQAWLQSELSRRSRGWKKLSKADAFTARSRSATRRAWSLFHDDWIETDRETKTED